MSPTLDEVQELHNQNIELLELLIVIGNRFFDYAEKYQMQIEGMESLSALIERAASLLEEMGTPYRGDPIRREDNSPRGNAIECFWGGTPLFARLGDGNMQRIADGQDEIGERSILL